MKDILTKYIDMKDLLVFTTPYESKTIKLKTKLDSTELIKLNLISPFKVGDTILSPSGTKKVIVSKIKQKTITINGEEQVVGKEIEICDENQIKILSLFVE
jgi:hypothetical protein